MFYENVNRFLNLKISFILLYWREGASGQIWAGAHEIKQREAKSYVFAQIHIRLFAKSYVFAQIHIRLFLNFENKFYFILLLSTT